ncbi:hypothetical protein GLAREA_05219 [Glarea lozoyensis ATCC 20868]|uniref:Uncharacterized protein n=1 Tax=Glarea lozoyensis (strain ATCC 20868 / MF5171) TaxID=1116229 RepID=S3DVB9_GLAL2|nr:uncharacterized protein GLAREA_05219 [Glarea lozoyensis ATCC 20868]EPE35881.1 hypothetical protein GLAREA_05219 [Glarea lozoyensis ATCC 20868]
MFFYAPSQIRALPAQKGFIANDPTFQDPVNATKPGETGKSSLPRRKRPSVED